MFLSFFFQLKQSGIPVTPTSFILLHKALKNGCIASLDDLYIGARSILIKHEKYFDRYDQVFAHVFRGMVLEEPGEKELSELVRTMLGEWLKNPEALALVLGVSAENLSKLTPDELVNYFLDRLKEQAGEHHGGSKWIGTGGTSPVGHSGHHPGGMRIGGVSGNKSAVKVALERRFKDYSHKGILTPLQIGEALGKLRNMVPEGPKNRVNIDKTISETMKKDGEIEIVFDRSSQNRIKVLLAIDNGGWSMDPFIETVQSLFNYARAQFKDLRTFYFHNTIYDKIWEDPSRWNKPYFVDELVRIDPETRFILVGDASMAPYELTGTNSSIGYGESSGKSSLDRLAFIAKTFPHTIWLNPVAKELWRSTYTLQIIRQIIPMFELTLDGLDAAIACLMAV